MMLLTLNNHRLNVSSILHYDTNYLVCVWYVLHAMLNFRDMRFCNAHVTIYRARLLLAMQHL